MIPIYTTKEIVKIRESGKILAYVMNSLLSKIKVGKSGLELDLVARKLIEEANAKPSFLGYRKFPAALCVSINEQLVHGVPSKRPFQKGDLISLDLGIEYKGFYSDKAATILLDDNTKFKVDFLRTIKNSLYEGINQAKNGIRIGVISNTIQNIIEKTGYYVVRDLSGHGIGRHVHEEPRVFNFGKSDDGPILKEGMVLAIEPMACLGTHKIKLEKDNMTISSFDDSLSAHFEETIVVTKNNPLILTKYLTLR